MEKDPLTVAGEYLKSHPPSPVEDYRYFIVPNLPFDRIIVEKEGLRYEMEEVNIDSLLTQARADERRVTLKEIYNMSHATKTNSPYIFRREIVEYAKSKGVSLPGCSFTR